MANLADRAMLVQRAYQAACPECGGMVVFQSAASTHAVCPYCTSTVVRQGDVLKKTGTAAQVFEDYSLLQIGTQGHIDGIGFTLIGRLQYQAMAGRWTEWLGLLDNEATFILSEDNGDYVLMRPLPTGQGLGFEIQTAATATLGTTLTVFNTAYSVTALHQTQLIAAQGECGTQPLQFARSFYLAELRSAAGDLLSISDINNINNLNNINITESKTGVEVYLGKHIDLNRLNLSNLKENATANLNQSIHSQSFNCPQCASPVQVQLATSQAITCPACHSVIDLSQGIGQTLKHALQTNLIRPQLALGSLGSFAGKSWQVLGYQHRIGRTLGTDNEDADQFGWEEYLLYNAQSGFQFLVDSSEGWSLVRPMTGAATITPIGAARYLGTTYRRLERYTAETDYVAGEFYWAVTKGYRTVNQDFAAGKEILNYEQANQEITWSLGQRLPAASVIAAFNIKPEQAALFQRDAAPTSLNRQSVITGLVVLAVIVVFIVLVSQNSDASRCKAEYNPYSTVSQADQLQLCLAQYRRSNYDYGGGWTGGSYGGYSSGGGGHK